MKNLSIDWFKNWKNIGKTVLMLGGFLFPLALILNILINKTDLLLNSVTDFKYNTFVFVTIVLLLMTWFSFILIPVTVKDYRNEMIWATILFIFAVAFAAIYISQFNYKRVIDYFLIVFIAHLLVGSVWWLITLMNEKRQQSVK